MAANCFLSVAQAAMLTFCLTKKIKCLILQAKIQYIRLLTLREFDQFFF